MIDFQHNCMKRRNANVTQSLPTTEIKILVLLCYFIFLASTIQAAITRMAQSSDQIYATFLNYFACELSGTSPNCDAAKVPLDGLTVPGEWVAANIFMGVFPFFQLIYILNFGDIKQKCLYWVCRTRKNEAKNGIINRNELTNMNAKKHNNP